MEQKPREKPIPQKSEAPARDVSNFFYVAVSVAISVAEYDKLCRLLFALLLLAASFAILTWHEDVESE